MTEPGNQEPQQAQTFEGFNPSYETLRDEIPGVPHSVREQWQRSDRDVAILRESYTSLQQDTDYTEEARARRATELYERQKDRIEQRWAQTRQELRKSAAASERMSIPRPSGQPLEAKDSSDLLAAQNEAGRIIRTLDRQSSRPGPFKPTAADFLKTEYQAGMEQGGVTGAARCRGAMAAAEELGVGLQWIDSLRDEKQRKYLDDARRLEMAAYAVPSKAPKPPPTLQKAINQASGRDMYQRQRMMFIPRGGSGETHLVSEPSHGGSSSAEGVSPPRPASKKRARKSWK